MSDLSRLLDDLYVGAEDDGKGLTSEEALDEAFSDWVPGPPDDASDTEKALFAEATTAAPAHTDAPGPLTDSNPAAPPSDRVESVPSSPPGTAAQEWAAAHMADTDSAEEAPDAPGFVAWFPEQDDILPERAARRVFGLSLRR